MKASIALVALLSLTQIGLAQPPAPAPLKNIQVFPKDISRGDLIAKMREFNGALGVQCTFCHVEDEATHRVTDYSLDDKPQKNMARKMVTMTQDINGKYLAGLGAPAGAVGCATCHQGHMQPQPFVAAGGGGQGGGGQGGQGGQGGGGQGGPGGGGQGGPGAGGPPRN